MGRLLSVEAYGTLNSLLSLMIVLTVPTNALILLIAKYTAEYKAANELDKLSVFLSRGFKYIGIIAIIFMIGILSSSAFINTYLKINNLSFVIMLTIISAITLLTTFPLGTLQGMKNFFSLGFINLLGTAVKFFISIFLVIAGMHIYGGLIGVLLGNIMIFLAGFIAVRKFTGYKKISSLSIDAADIIKFLVPLLTTNLCISLFTSMDIVIIKHYLSPESTGLYSCAALLGKAMFYSTTSIVTVLFPTVIYAKGNNMSAVQPLKKALMYTFVLCLLCISALYILAPVIVRLLFGLKYIKAIEYIRLVPFMITAYCLLNIIINYALAVGSTKTISISMIGGCILVYILLIFYHSTVEQVIYILLIVGIFLLIINLLSVFNIKIYKKKIL